MEPIMKINEYMDLVKQGNVARELLPMGLNAGWPYLTIRNKQLCVTIPYYRSELKPNDGTLLFPISYCMTTVWPSAKVVGYNNLRYDKAFKKINFDKPVGTFRHEAIKNLGKTEYTALRDELLACYDELIGCIFSDTAFENQPRMTQLLQLLMEPSMRPLYLYLCKPFFETYLGEAK